MIFGAFERMVAFRYLRARRQESFISVIAFFSLAGIMLGVATLIIVMSVMNGFRAELMEKILGFNGDLSVVAMRAGGIADYDALAAKARAVSGVTTVIPLVESEVLVSGPSGAQGAKVRGQRPSDIKAQFGDKISMLHNAKVESLDDDSVLLGRRLAYALGVGPGDQVTLLSPNGTATALGTVPRVKTYKVAGTFDVGMYEYDSGFVYMTLPAAQLFFKLPDAVSQLEIKVVDPDAVWQQKGAVQTALGPNVRLFDWQQSSAAFFNAVQTERNVMFLILTLIIVVAAFNVISSMIMLVKDKGRDIAILRTMGATRGTIMRIFFMAGASVGVVGTTLGFFLGLGFCENIERIRGFLQSLTGTDLFNAEIYFLSQIPIQIDTGEVATIVGLSFALSFLATLYPSWRAARLDPVEALRYE
jgi:lipoprotein-releasing system permease protein